MEIKTFKIFEQEITLSPVIQPTTEETSKVQTFGEINDTRDSTVVGEQPTTEDVEKADDSRDDMSGKEVVSDQTQPSNDCVELFSKLFESRQMAHVYHLQVKGEPGSYAAHAALGSFYEDILELTDSLIETYQGQYGIVANYLPIDTKSTQSQDKVAYFEELAGLIKTERKCFSVEDTHLHNIIDEIVALNYSLIYKLKYTK